MTAFSREITKARQKYNRAVRNNSDDVYGGIFSGLSLVDANTWNLVKPLYNHAESLIVLLAIIEHTSTQWAQDLFSQVYAFTIEKYVQD